MSERSDLADFLRQQARSADFGHDRERFARAADLLEAPDAAPETPPSPTPESAAAPAAESAAAPASKAGA